MKKVFHILNGDALKENLPDEILGEQIVMRECLVEGPVSNSIDNHSLSAFYKNRSTFLFENYKVESSIYHNTSMSEIEKIRQIESGSQIFLWFEDDLFCQVNMWFICSLLNHQKEISVALIRPSLAFSNNKLPETLLQYGFGGLDTPLLKSAFQNSQPLSIQHISQFADLWRLFVLKNESKLLQISLEMNEDFEFISKTVKACIGMWNGHPKELIKEIVSELDTYNFRKIFQAFNRRGAIYGFGDLQVKRIYEELKDHNISR